MSCKYVGMIAFPFQQLFLIVLITVYDREIASVSRKKIKFCRQRDMTRKFYMVRSSGSNRERPTKNAVDSIDSSYFLANSGGDRTIHFALF